MKRRVSEQLIRDELEGINHRADQLGWEVDADLDDLVITTRMTASDDEEYIIEFECSNYDQAPPYVELIHPNTGERGVPKAYFDDRGAGQALLLKQTPALCHGFNRKMYLDVDTHHDEWNRHSIARWKDEAGSYTTLTRILMLIDKRITNDHYQGRLSE
jgi:hypothetical protein